MTQVFGYPSFDEKGEKILTTYDNAYKEMGMDIRVYRIHEGETRRFFKEEEEMAVLLLEGEITYKWDEKEQKVSRSNVFDMGPWCLHVCQFNARKISRNFLPGCMPPRTPPGYIPVRANSEIRRTEE